MIQSTPVETAYRNLQTLMLEYRDTQVPKRVDLYVARFPSAEGCNTLAEYIEESPIDACWKLSMLSSLTAIVSARDWSRLPEISQETNGEKHAAVSSAVSEDQPYPVSIAQIKAIARKEARAELADVLEKVAKVLRE